MNHKEDRVVAIDVLKGVAIALVILAHLSATVLVDEWDWAYYLIFMFLDVFGPSLFVFLSSLSVIFSVKKKRNNYNEKAIRNTIFQRASMLLLMSFVINLLGSYQILGIYAFWNWQVIQFIGFAQIFTYYILKLQRHQRILIAFIIAYGTPILFNHITTNMFTLGIDYNLLTYSDFKYPITILYHFLFSPIWGVPMFPWIFVVLVGSVFGENLVFALNARQEGDKKIYQRFFHNSMVDGILLTSAGILTGLRLTKEDFGLNVWQGIRSGTNLFPDGIPEFFVHSSVPNIMYSMGIGLLLISISFYICEIKGHKGKYVKFFVFYGRFSLTLFMLHYIFLIGNKDKLDPIGLFTLYFVAIAGLGLLLYIWRYRWNAVGTLEWLMIAAGGFRKSKKKKEESEELKEQSEEHHFWFKPWPKQLFTREKKEGLKDTEQKENKES